jgi:hypothetical protein
MQNAISLGETSAGIVSKTRLTFIAIVLPLDLLVASINTVFSNHLMIISTFPRGFPTPICRKLAITGNIFQDNCKQS